MLERIKNNTAKKIARIKELGIAAKLILLLMTVSAAVIFALVFKSIVSFELNHAYNWDSPLYWAVGRGMINGLKPYAEMYENKPLGIFLVSALSFLLTDDTVICNIVSVLAVFLTAILPVTAIIGDRKTTEKNDNAAVMCASGYMIVLFTGLMLAFYSEKRSGGFQVEAIGAAFSILFICLVKKRKNDESRPKRVILTLSSALAVCCAVMFKEPFLLISVFGALLFVDSFKGFLRNILLPCLIGGAFFAAVLAVTGVFVPYFTIYFKQMFETRLSGSSAFLRAFNVLKVFKDLWRVSHFLFVLILLLMTLMLLRMFLNRKSTAGFVFDVVKVIAAVFIASFCVGLGGQYFNHHYVFAVPVYCAFVIIGSPFLFQFKPQRIPVTVSVLLLGVLILISSARKIGLPYKYSHTEDFSLVKTKAEYVDLLLDYYGAERYQFIGFNEDEKFFGLTKHSPQGPVFVQDPVNFISKNTWFYQSFAEQLNECDVIILDYYSAPGTLELVETAVESDFTETPAREFDVSPPDGFDCQIYYRTSKFG
ncbi:MAG: hypothetical protein IJG87_05165 [Ruminococcus sp.]|nr:hypothetical protein [Ruminococcus sp.]